VFISAAFPCSFPESPLLILALTLVWLARGRAPKAGVPMVSEKVVQAVPHSALVKSVSRWASSSV